MSLYDLQNTQHFNDCSGNKLIITPVPVFLIWESNGERSYVELETMHISANLTTFLQLLLRNLYHNLLIELSV
jgi:hypothetical protein